VGVISTDSQNWHHREVDALTKEHQVDPSYGLSHLEVAARRLRYGTNALENRTGRTKLALLADQFKNPMVIILLGAAIISGVIGDAIDALAIVVIIFLTSGIGFFQSLRADRAMAALQAMATPQATVIRDGQIQLIASDCLVPGDIVYLEAGNQVPADLRLIELSQLRVDESALTGESVTVCKQSAALPASAYSPLGDRLNMAFRGTIASHGRAHGLVVAIGMSTEIGKIARLLDQNDPSTPLQKQLALFGKRLAIFVIVISAAFFGAGVWRGEPVMQMALLAISLAVAAIPEALPAVVTVLLALGARHMVGLHALVRRLPLVETLGSVTVICSDKTGTLTQNCMQVECLAAGGRVWESGESVPGPLHHAAWQAAVLCNDARQANGGLGGGWLGDPTEVALVEAANFVGINKNSEQLRWPRVQEYPFDSSRRRMTTLHKAEVGFIAFTKGAPESVLPCCQFKWTTEGLIPLDQDELMQQATMMAAQGMRVLALARRDHLAIPDPNQTLEAEQQLAFLGLIGLIDPPRVEIAAAVRDCLSAGIAVIMITGDHPATALAIALRVGIVSDAEAKVLTGQELALLDKGGLLEQVDQVKVYARVDPAQKIRIVEALQARGHVVAMTGDGINDAPALQRADVGVAMGKGGTDVARQAAGIVLLDDNFATIVAAIREGRRIVGNIRKFIRYALTGNSGEMWLLLLAPMLMLPMPLLPIHILWVNLVTDGLPGLALAAEPAERNVMLQPPRAPDESLFSIGMWPHILVVGLLIGGLCLTVQAWALSTTPEHSQTMVFTLMTFSQMTYVMVIRSESQSLWRLGLYSNLPLLGAVVVTLFLQMALIYIPALNSVFQTAPLSFVELSICVGAALALGLLLEIEKGLLRRKI
jgi:Ca2+-transporting ATPase